MRRPLALTLLLSLLLPASANASEQDIAAFYRGKQIMLIVGYPPGAGYDAYARLLARHIGSHIPGNPTVVPSNMGGAGSMILANYLYNRAVKDGTVIGAIAGDAALNPLYGEAQAQYDARKLSWIGSMSDQENTCFAWNTAPIKTIDDVFHQDFMIGSSSSTGTGISYPKADNYLLGTKFKIISGYDGTAGVMLAIERGEVQGMCGMVYDVLRSTRPEWIEKKLINVILQDGPQRKPALPDVPTVMDIAKTDEQKKVIELIYGWEFVGRPIVAPPDLPPERLATLRRAFDSSMSDPALLAEADKLALSIDSVTGQNIDAFLTRVYQLPQAIVDEAATALDRRGQNKR